MLSIIIFLPLVACLAVLALPAGKKSLYQFITIAVAIVQLAMTAFIYTTGQWKGIQNVDQSAYQFVEKTDWIDLQLGSLGKLDIDYFVAVDGLSAGLLLLSAIVILVAAVASSEIKHNQKGYYALFLLLNMAIMGTFCALDFFLFYLFYELMLLPLYFLIGMWGGERREYAAIKFFLYTLFGSVFMLLVIIGLYFSVTDPASGSHTFNMLLMMDPANYQSGSIFSAEAANLVFGYPARLIGFIIVFIAFAIKVPVVPFHTWLPDAHVEAPTPISIILAGLLLKVGAYGILRIAFGIFPDAAIAFSYWIGLLGLISIIYGAFNALAATDLKRLIAYSSVSHMGFVLLGLASLSPEGMNGAALQLISHGILSTMLFFLVGILYNRVQDREIAHFSGLTTQMPRYAAFVMIAFFASLGLPGFSAFIGEAFVLMGAFTSESSNHMIPRWMAIGGSFGILLGAAYFLWTLQRMFFGALNLHGKDTWKAKLTDLTIRESAVLLVLTLFTLAIGVFPATVFNVCNDGINAIQQHVLVIGKGQLIQLFEF